MKEWKGVCVKNDRMKGSVWEKWKNERESVRIMKEWKGCVRKMKEWKGVCTKNERLKGKFVRKMKEWKGVCAKN